MPACGPTPARDDDPTPRPIPPRGRSSFRIPKVYYGCESRLDGRPSVERRRGGKSELHRAAEWVTPIPREGRIIATETSSPRRFAWCKPSIGDDVKRGNLSAEQGQIGPAIRWPIGILERGGGAGRLHELVGNGGPRGMTIPPPQGGGQNSAYRPTLTFVPANALTLAKRLPPGTPRPTSSG